MATICGTLENRNITKGCHMANMKIVFWSVFVFVFLCRFNMYMWPPCFYLLHSLNRDGLTVTLQRPENCPISNFISRMSVFHWKLSFQHSPTTLKTFNWSFDQEDELMKKREILVSNMLRKPIQNVSLCWYISTSRCMILIKFESRFFYFYFSIIFRISMNRQRLGSCNIILLKRLWWIALTKNMHSKTRMVKKYKNPWPSAVCVIVQAGEHFLSVSGAERMGPGAPIPWSEIPRWGITNQIQFLTFLLDMWHQGPDIIKNIY